MERNRRPSDHTVSVLEVLSEKPHSWRYGYELSQITGLKSGTLYPILMRLSDRGLLDSRWQPAKQPGRPPRHVHRLTSSGSAFAREALSHVADRGRHELAGEVG
jgi:PadR family transcriptional regulator, regulatory protein PadR